MGLSFVCCFLQVTTDSEQMTNDYAVSMGTLPLEQIKGFSVRHKIQCDWQLDARAWEAWYEWEHLIQFARFRLL
jgi:hypothetical protein